MAETELIDWTPLERVLEEYGNAVAELYRQNLIKSDHLATEQLLNSVSYHLVTGDKTYAVTIELADYWRYVEYGRKAGGKQPPPDAIKKWMRVRLILPQEVTLHRIVRTKTKGTYIKDYHPTENQLAYLIGRRIKERGIKGSYDLTNAVQECNRQYREKITATLQEICSGLVVRWMANYF